MADACLSLEKRQLLTAPGAAVLGSPCVFRQPSLSLIKSCMPLSGCGDTEANGHQRHFFFGKQQGNSAANGMQEAKRLQVFAQ